MWDATRFADRTFSRRIRRKDSPPTLDGNYFNRPLGDLEEPSEIGIRKTRTSFRNVRRNRNRSPSHLTDEPKSLVRRKRGGCHLHGAGEFDRFVPHVLCHTSN